MDENDEDNIDETAEEREEKKKKKGGKGETGAATRTGEVVVSQRAYERMGLLGLSAAKIAEILRTWRHYQGEGLFRRLIDFARGTAKASAHAEVEIKADKDFGLVHNLLQHLKALPRALMHKRTFDPRNTPGPGPQ